jgi:plastocyanin
MKSRTCQIGLTIIAIAMAACSGGGASNSTGVTGGTGGGGGGNNNSCTAGDGIICVQATSFNPIDLTISKGGTATFQEVAGVHNIVFDAPLPTGVSDVGEFSAGSTARTFTTTGTFAYHCTIHGSPGSGMHGTIKVQ